MEEYNIQRKLRTYSVDLQLLRDIEALVIKKLPAILPVSPGDHPLEGHTTLLLSSDEGTENITPASKYTRQRFDNNIEKAALEFSYWAGLHDYARQAMLLTIRFSSDSEDSELSITLRAQGAREKVAELERSLLQQLEKNKNINWIPYPNELIPTVIFVAGFLAFIFSFMAAHPVLKTACLLLFTVAVYLVMHRFMKGYCSFDSVRQRRLDAIFKVLIIIIIGFIAVSMLTPLRKMWWGF